MPLSTALVGQSTQPITHRADARWLMAYAAALGDMNPRYLDTSQNTVVAHPLFPVCPEWPAILATRALAGNHALSEQEAARGVHAAHDLHILKPIQAGDELATTATLIGIEPIKPGAAYQMRLDTTNTETGELVARTYQLGIYRGVAIEGEPTQIETAPDLPNMEVLADGQSVSIPVPAGLAHTYTECARIWNPIHTDKAVALAAGLPDIILHGTATLALAVTQIVNRYANEDPTRVTRIGGRFAAMVLMPSTITMRCHQQAGLVSFEVDNAEGQTAIQRGFVELHS